MKRHRTSKLVELRIKTDRELLALIGPELKRALILANVAASRESAFYKQAAKIVDAIAALLPTIRSVDRSERKALESRMGEVRQALGLMGDSPAGRPSQILQAGRGVAKFLKFHAHPVHNGKVQTA